MFSVKPLFKRFQRFEKPLYGLKDRSLKANWYEIFDYQDFLDRMGGDRDLPHSLLKDIPGHLSGEIRKLKTALNEKNAADIRLYAHTVKGVCANFSARRLSEAASRIEAAGKEGRTDIADLLTGLEQEFEIFQSALSEVFPGIFKDSEETRCCEAEEILPENMREHLPELLRRLEEELIPKSKKLEDVFFIEDAEEFIAEVKQTADEYHSDFLACYSRELKEASQNLNIDKMKKLTSEFPELIDRMMKMNKSQ